MVILRNGNVVYSGSLEQVGEKCCIISLIFSQAVAMGDFITHVGCKYELEGNSMKIIGKTISDTMKAVEKVEKSIEVKSMNCEYPAFYEGVLNLVKNN